MTYSDPPTVATGDVAPSSLWNTYVRGNFQALDRGITGVHSIGTGGGFGERYYPTFPWTVRSVGETLATSTGTLYAVPLITPRGGTLDRIAYEITTAGGAGGVGRQGIYQATSATNPYPSALIVDGGEHVVTSTGLKITTISVSPEPDILYWAVVLFGTNAPTVGVLFESQMTWSPIGLDPAVSTVQSAGMFTRTQAYGALPSTFPATPTTYSSQPIRMAMRYSA